MAVQILCLSLLVFGVSANALFENRFYTPSYDESLVCATSEQGFFPLDQIKKIVEYYESQDSRLRERTAHFMTVEGYSNPDHLSKFETYYQKCGSAGSESALCVLTKVFESEEIALRALALFYDTQVLVDRSNSEFLNFTLNQIRMFEKVVRKIPNSLREKIVKVVPADFDRQRWDGRLPMKLSPNNGNGVLGGMALAQVLTGMNYIGISVNHVDKAKEGNRFSDIDRVFFVDFRLQMIVHEFGHVIDTFFNLAPNTHVGTFGSNSEKLSNSASFQALAVSQEVAIWPSHWWDAMHGHPFVKNGRYVGSAFNKNYMEIFAEGFAQYILYPEGLKAQSPAFYDWYKANVFAGEEFKGYGSCTKRIARKLRMMESLVSPNLHNAN